MSPKPIRDYVGEALARSLNGKAARFDTNGGGDGPKWPRNRGFNGGGFQPEFREAPHQKRESQQQEQSTPLPREAQWKVGSFTAEELETMKFPPTSFLVEGIIPAEGVTLLCSKPKFGKSWLAYDLCIGCTMNRMILGDILPAQGDVLYLALEDSKRRHQRRMSKLPAGIPWPRNLTLKTEWRRLHEGGLDDVRAWHADSKSNGGKPVLVNIDVLAKVRKPTGNKQLYEADYEALTGLTRLPGELGLAVVVVHHTRKMASDDLMETVSGSFSISGAADAVLVLANKASGTVLDIRGRDVESRELAIEFSKESCRWRILGMATEVHSSNQRGRILAALEDANEGLAVAEIVVAAQLRSRNAADILLHKMTKAGEIEWVRRGVYGLPGTVAKLAAKDTGKIGKKDRAVKRLTLRGKSQIFPIFPIFPVAGRTQPKPRFWLNGPDEDGLKD
jgi:AAA domain